MDIKNKIVVVTGASSGIGKAAAELLTEQGARVALVARSENKITELAKKLPDSFPIVADMSKENEIKDMIEKIKNHYGRIDILINNAGQGYGSPVEKIDPDKFRYLFDLNVIGPMVAMQTVIPIMRSQGGGMIVNISSGTSYMYMPSLGAYSATKRALNGLALTARAELEKDNIKVSLVHPYITATDFYKNTIKTEGAGGHVRESENGERPQPDTAEYMAEKILEVIRSEAPEQFAHEWMSKDK